MGQTNILTKEEFELDKTLKSKYGSYENYTTSFQQGVQTENDAGATSTNAVGGNANQNTDDYTFGDVVNVANGGEKSTDLKTNSYDTYMQEALNIYNQGVEANNKNAANQAAAAGSQYNEVNRFANELNKANGRANTGYAGDTSIDAYNAYRNSVNESYANADKANNDLYSYYLSEMTRLQQLKDDKEAQINSDVEGKLDTLKGDNAYYASGKITDDAAKRMYEYAKERYGENIPPEIMSILQSEPGFSEWLENYNNSSTSYYDTYGDKIYSVESYRTTDDSDLKHVSSKEGDDFKINYNGQNYKMETRKPTLTQNQYNTIDSNLGNHHGAIIYFNGKLYVRASDGSIMEAIGTNQDNGSGARDLISAMQNDGKVK